MSQQEQSRLIATNSHAVKCGRCDLPCLEIRAGLVVIRNRHHGQVHENTFSLDWLQKQIQQAQADSLPVAA